MIPQIIYLALSLIGWGYVAAKHGQPKDENYNIWTSSISSVIIFFILWWGGFFNCLF